MIQLDELRSCSYQEQGQMEQKAGRSQLQIRTKIIIVVVYSLPLAPLIEINKQIILVKIRLIRVISPERRRCK